MHSWALLMTTSLLVGTACVRTRVVEKPVEVLVPVAAPPAEPCLRSDPPVRPLGVFERCVMPEIVACLTRTSMESLVSYLEASESWMAGAVEQCGESS
jgi:hypothetical protein